MSEPPSKEELYEIYKELRDDGIIWTDAKAKNVGKLMKPNIKYSPKIGEIDDNGNITWGSQKYAGKAAGFDSQPENQEVLMAGEYVILDLDFVWEEGDKSIIWPSGGSYSFEFEKRYQEEKVKANTKDTIKQNDEEAEK